MTCRDESANSRREPAGWTQYLSRAMIFAALVGSSLLLCSHPAAAAQCTPFGDPPAKLPQGFIGRALSAFKPICFGGRLLNPWTDSNGSERHACIYEPERHGSGEPLPLVVFLHGSLATADSIVLTDLVDEIDRADLSGDKPGFILLAPAGRHTVHYYPSVDSNAMGWDNWYRQLSQSGDVTLAGTTYKENVDAAAIDHFIRDEIASGEVDTRRIYLTGWSNGAAMALLHALNRPWIAAAAVYSAPDPFGAFNDPCPQSPVRRPPASNAELQISNPRVAVMHVRNSCDIAGTCPNGNALALQLRSIGVSLDDRILDPEGKPLGACDDSCGTSPMAGGSELGVRAAVRGARNHLRWPSAWNTRMFEFMKQHPLPATRK
jgi:predicted esterase